MSISETQIFILGGYNHQKKDIISTYTIDILTSKVQLMNNLPKPCWSVMPIYYFNNNLHIFYPGEPKYNIPEVIIYPFSI